jgi:para-aminobenzoate synthetase component 1
VTLEFDTPPAGAGHAAPALLAAIGRASPAPEMGNTGGVPCSLVEHVGDGTMECPHGRRAAMAPASNRFVSNFTPDAYRAAVARCVEYIAAGDIFQVNLSQRFSRAVTAGPMTIYRQLRRRNPAWYAGYLAAGPWAVLSSSPELFLRVRDGRVTTRPIKGTRPRTGDAAVDAVAAAELQASAKDNAELAMIIDLMRNDLGRVCRYGSVRVTQPRVLEAHPTVFHLVGTVEGDLHERYDRVDLLRATFPGGSITGAPKIRAMEIIDELEPVARGVYTGSLCHFGVDGSAELSIAIRTAVWDAGTVHVQAGGGIVADSTPDGEYRETLDKARAVLEAVDAAEQEYAAKSLAKREISTQTE